jgi:medium-chain acyl-[acyl-carrier-protein] hydrolase
LPPNVGLYAIQPPGRERRYREKPISDLLELAEAISDEVSAYSDAPYAFFGHSMGALVALEACRALRRRELPLPSLLFVSGRMPPSKRYNLGPLHTLPDGRFVDEIRRRYGGLPEAVSDDPELLALFLPTLRADVVAHETYRYRPEKKLRVPIVGLAGVDDRTVRPSELDGWADETTSFEGVKVFRGGHFFIQSEQESVVSFLGECIQRYVVGPMRSGERGSLSTFDARQSRLGAR